MEQIGTINPKIGINRKFQWGFRMFHASYHEIWLLDISLALQIQGSVLSPK